MKKIKIIILLSFFLLVLFSSFSLAASVPFGATTCTNTNHEVIESNNPRQEIVNGWKAAISGQTLGGKSWIGKLQSNGPNDNDDRVDTGRETIIFVPCSTDFSKKIEVMYFFHGLTGFSYHGNGDSYNDMNLRVAPQAKILSGSGRNFVIVFPEMPWSAGTAKRSNQNDIWKDGDSNLIQLHQDAINILKQNFNPGVDVGYVSMVGHSAGGAALRHGATRPSKSDNALKSIGVNKIVFSDSDYGWGFSSSSPFEEQPSALLVYEHYLQYNSNAEMYMLVQDPSRRGAHRPTQFAILTVKQLGAQYDAQVASWYTENVKWNTKDKEKSSTPGAVTGQVLKVPGHPNVNYVPLDIGHKNIGKMSMAWTYSGSSAYGAITLGQTNVQTPSGTIANSPTSYQKQAPGGQNKEVPKGLPKRQEEIDEAWLKVSNFVASEGVGKVWDKTLTNAWSWQDIKKVYYTIQQGSAGSSPSYGTPHSLSNPGGILALSSPGQCFPLTSDSFTKISSNWGNPRDDNTRCHVGIDIYNKPPGIVVALEAGTVVAVKNFYECKDGWGAQGINKKVSAVYVYNPQLKRTINYGEIDNDKVAVNPGDSIVPGQKIGVASYCGTNGKDAMLHLEVYSGMKDENIKWEPNNGYSTDCKVDSLTKKHQDIQNPTNLIQQLQGQFCDPTAGSSSGVNTNFGNTLNSNRVTPQTCSYEDNGLKQKKYSEIGGEVFDPSGSGCTLCREDQKEINVNCNGQSLSFKICWKYEAQIKNAIQNICNSGFNIFDVVGFREGRTYSSKTKFGQHPYGLAVDINREYNGLYDNCNVWDSSKCSLSHGGSKNKLRDQSFPGTITKSSPAYQNLVNLGWKWGGEWSGNQKDFMHFSLSGK